MSGHVQLSPAERDRIAELRASGLSLRVIAEALARAPSAISRELRRKACPSGADRPQLADGPARGIERGLRAVSAETIHAWIVRPGQKTSKLWRFLPWRKARRG